MEISQYPSLPSKNKNLKFHAINFHEASVAWWLISLLQENSNTILYIGKDEKEIRRIQKNLFIFISLKKIRSITNDCVHVFSSRDVYPFSFLSLLLKL